MTLRTSSASRSWLSAPLSSFLLFAGSIVFVMALAEGILRLFPGLLSVQRQQIVQAADPDNMGIAHPYIGYLHKPFNTGVMSSGDFRAIQHTDGYGFRNTWPWPTRAEIVALGDSFTFGYGVEDDQSWPAILARTLAPNRVINLGLIGAGTNQYLRVYETFGVRLHPKLTLIGAFMENDFWDAEMFDLWLKSGAGGDEMYWKVRGQFEFELSWRHPVTDLKGALKLHSYLFNLVKSARDSWASGKPVFYSCSHGGRVRLVLSDLENAAARSRPGRSDFQLVLDALVRIHELAKREQSQMLVLFLPSKEEVYLPLLGSDVPDLTSSLDRALEKEGIEYLDLAPALRQRAAAGECLYFGTDGHPNAGGHAAMAEIIAAHIKQNAQKYGLVSYDKPLSLTHTL